ncbi:hypothetical protein AB4P97_15195 [Pseudomonas sp. A1230]|uniref:hypothetical protein n=1 Tax=Pseudomonas sp. A1230 TaxID=3235106 RepID=UPI003782DBEE
MTSPTDNSTNNNHAHEVVNNAFKKITDQDMTTPVANFLATSLENFEPSHKSKIDEYRAALEEAFILQNAVDQSLSTLEPPQHLLQAKAQHDDAN